MKRLLCIVGSMNIGGAETFLMKVYRQLDKSIYQMDFCVNLSEENAYEREILSLGGKFYRIPAKTVNFIKFKKELYTLISSNQYEYVLRITSNALGFYDLKIAKKAGARITIARSSNSSDGESRIIRVVNTVCRLLLQKWVDKKIAPSDLAAEYTFGKNNKIIYLHNGLDLKKFSFSLVERDRVREELGINKDIFVVGHVGRFNEQKNHKFLIDVFSDFHNVNPSSVLMLIGDGELIEEIRKYVKVSGIEEYVIFTGVRSDVSSVMSAMDVFVFPSLYEGMPNAVVEAQANGLPCLISKSITKDAILLDSTKEIDIHNKELWIEELNNIMNSTNIPEFRTQATNSLMSQGYDINDVVNHFVTICYGE